MTPFRSVLAATDFSVGGNNAVRRAALIAQQLDAHLNLLHIVEPVGHVCQHDGRARAVDGRIAQARATLHRMSAHFGAIHGVAIGFEVLTGDPFSELLHACSGADLIVLGHGGKRRFRHLVIGRFAQRFLRCCPRPVLAVKRPVEGEYRRLLVPVDFAACSQAALLAAAGLAGNGELHVFHALGSKRDTVLREAGGPGQTVRESLAREEAGTSARLRRSLARLGPDSRRMGITLSRGPAVPSTLRQAGIMAADLIVAGKQGHVTIARFLLGRVSRHLLAQSPCDIMIVPPPVGPATLPSRPDAPPASLSRRSTLPM